MLQKRTFPLLGLVFTLVMLSQFPNTNCSATVLERSEYCPKMQVSDMIVLTSHVTQIDIPEVDEIYVTEIYNIENRLNYSVSSLTLWLNHSCSNVTVEDGTGTIDYDILVQTSSYLQLFFNLNQVLDTNDTTSFYLSYNLDMMPIYEDESDYYNLEYSSTINYYTQNLYLLVKLPENSYIHEEAGLTSIYPTNQTQSFAGKRLIISWSLQNLLPSFNPLFIVRYDPPSLEPSNPPIWAFVVGPLLGISVGFVITYLLMRRKEDKSIKDIGTLFLNESQKTLLRIINEAGGKIAQNELGRKADFTRAKTSRNLLLLEEQGLIRKEKWGRNAIVYLSKSGEKVIE